MKYIRTDVSDDIGFPVLKRVPEENPETNFTPCPPAEREKYETARWMLEAASGGKNTLLFDDLGYPSVMVKIPCFNWSDVIEGGEDAPCSAFVVNGEVKDYIYISKYLNVMERGRAYSLPERDPANAITIDEARAACAAKGRGWHLLTNAEWCAVVHWSMKNGTIPYGNGHFGACHAHPWERGILVRGNEGTGMENEMRTLTGSGPDSWNHDHGPWGINDLTGNVWDWVSGFRTVDGEIQFIPDNDSAANVDEGPDSTLWRAVLPDGTLVKPGTPGTLHYEGNTPGRATDEDRMVLGGYTLNTKNEFPNYTGTNPDTAHRAYGFMQFFDLKAAEGVEVPQILKNLGAMPPPGDYRETSLLFLRNYGERVCARGGSWFDGPGAGLWDVYLRETRAFLYPDIGFRSAFIEL